MFLFWWFIWKEWNHRIFDQEECSYVQVVQQIKDAISAFRAVHLIS
jgi:hypothetical protein